MSQITDVYDHLYRGNSVTPLEALKLFSSMRLSSIIFDLRQEGHNIKTIMIKDGKKCYAKYVMER